MNVFTMTEFILGDQTNNGPFIYWIFATGVWDDNGFWLDNGIWP